METVKVPDQFTPKGRIVVRGYASGTIKKVEPFAAALMRCRQQLKQLPLTPEYDAMRKRTLHRIDELNKRLEAIFQRYALGLEAATDNLIMTGALTGRDLIVQYLTNGTIYTGGINYGALGTGTTTPAAGDTQLAAESARAPFSITNDVSYNQVQLQFYFPDANLANGVYHEAGSFMNGSATANSGQIFNHALLGTPFTKTVGTDVTLEIDLYFN